MVSKNTWKWHDYYRCGLVLSACGSICMVLALPGLIVCLYNGFLDIIWLIFILACIMCAGEILIRYGMYRKRWDQWAELLIFLSHTNMKNELKSKDDENE